MFNLHHRLKHPTSLDRFLFFFFSDIVLFTVSLCVSFLFHFDFDPHVPYLSLVQEVLPYFVIIKLATFGIFRIYRITWRYVGIFDLVNIVLALMFSAMTLIILSLPLSFFPHDLPLRGFPKRIILEDCIISIFLISGLRISKRFYREILRKSQHTRTGKRTVIIGAGNTADIILRDIIRQGYKEFSPLGLLDDDAAKMNATIHGVKVHGTTDALKNFIKENRIEAVIIAIPSLNYKKLREIYQIAKNMKIETIKIVPRIYDYDRPDINLKTLEDISVEDLIGRQVVSVDYKNIESFLKDKKVFISGAGGSIGSEIVNQVCSFGPAQVILFDIDETDLHNLGLKLNRLHPRMAERIVYVTGDVRDEMRLWEVFQSHTPEIVFHAAAYKHVPMMEFNPKEAVKVNILGTYNLARVSVDHGVEKFIMISTDKAVRPTSIMGATKRMAESICQAMNSYMDTQHVCESGASGQGFSHANPHNPLPSPTRFISVRFGNVLGSRGSVLPLFLEQLKHGGPLTVTHKEMRRYFMTIPEAVSLVLQASMMGDGGEVFVLDMGESVSITHLAEELIRIHGMEPYRDIEIEFTGLRPGEKLFEEILTAEEGTVATKHERLYIANISELYSLPQIECILSEFKEAIADPSLNGDKKIQTLLKKYVKHYES